MLILVMFLLDGSFISLLSVSLIVFWPEWPSVLVIDWLSGRVGLFQVKFVGVWLPRSCVLSSSGWCRLFVPMGPVLPTNLGFACACGVCYSIRCRFCLCLFFQLVWMVLVPRCSADVAGEGCSQEALPIGANSRCASRGS